MALCEDDFCPECGDLLAPFDPICSCVPWCNACAEELACACTPDPDPET